MPKAQEREHIMKKEFRIRFEKFDLTSCNYQEQTLISYDEEFVNYKINELYHNDDVGFIFVDKKDEEGCWIPCDVCDDDTQNWKEYSHKFYLINL